MGHLPTLLLPCSHRVFGMIPAAPPPPPPRTSRRYLMLRGLWARLPCPKLSTPEASPS